LLFFCITKNIAIATATKQTARTKKNILVKFFIKNKFNKKYYRASGKGFIKPFPDIK